MLRANDCHFESRDDTCRSAFLHHPLEVLATSWAQVFKQAFFSRNRGSVSRVRSSRSPLILVDFFSTHFSSLESAPFRPFQLSTSTDGFSGRDQVNVSWKFLNDLTSNRVLRFNFFGVCSNSIKSSFPCSPFLMRLAHGFMQVETSKSCPSSKSLIPYSWTSTTRTVSC